MKKRMKAFPFFMLEYLVEGIDFPSIVAILILDFLFKSLLLILIDVINFLSLLEYIVQERKSIKDFFQKNTGKSNTTKNSIIAMR